MSPKKWVQIRLVSKSWCIGAVRCINQGAFTLNEMGFSSSCKALNFAKSVGLTRLNLSNLPVALDCPAEDFVTEFYHMLFDYSQLVISALPFDLPRLVLNKTRIDDAKQIALSSLTNLHQLDLSNNQISDAGLSSLSPLTNLHKLGLSNNQISDAGRAALKQALTSLQNI